LSLDWPRRPTRVTMCPGIDLPARKKDAMTSTRVYESSHVSRPVRTHRRRDLPKLAGEVRRGGRSGVAPDVMGVVARGVAPTCEDVEVSIVVGGGNFFRGAELSQRGMDRTRADYMGMLGTVMNCLALQDFLEQLGVDTRVQTAI